MEKKTYLDYAATTPCDPRVINTMLPYFSKKFGNPSSIHSYGQQTRRVVEKAREKIAGYLGADSSEVIFTSGGTESNNTAIKGIAYANKERGNHIVASSVEHHSVLKPCEFLEEQGFNITYIPVDGEGLVDINEIKEAITEDTILISIMHANNEVGTIQPLANISRITKEKGIYLHTDAVQTFGHIPVNVDELGIDLLSASAHKLYGPKGMGLLYIRKGTRLKPFMDGGEQERGRRASTENVPGIAGLGKAAEIALEEMDEETERLRYLQKKMTEGILERLEKVKLNGHLDKRLPNNINVSIKYAEGEALVVRLNSEGICCSTGSACSSSSIEASHVLKAMQVPEDLARSCLRFSLGRFTTERDIDFALDKLVEVVKKIRYISPRY
ncbi:MAG: cysteine desulfurase NifS [Candidatus Humimicrobiaceae bacterium]